MSKEQVIINVDGRPKILRLGFNGFVELEEALGKPITEISNGEVAFKDLRTIFQVALKRGGMRNITPEETGDILDTVTEEEGLDYLVDKLTEVIEGSMGGAPEEGSFPDSNKE